MYLPAALSSAVTAGPGGMRLPIPLGRDTYAVCVYNTRCYEGHTYAPRRCEEHAVCKVRVLHSYGMLWLHTQSGLHVHA